MIAPIEQLDDESAYRRELAWGSALAAFAAAALAFGALWVASVLDVPAVVAVGTTLALFAFGARKVAGRAVRRSS